MMRHWRRVAILLLAGSTGFAAVSGTVVNKTSDTAQPDALVTLYQLGQQGMQPVTAVKTGPDGAFRIDQTIQGPHLLQTIYDGVIYNRMIQPGAPTTDLELDVFDSTSNRTGVGIDQHMILVEPMGGILHINESIVVRNTGNTTFDDTKSGVLRVYLPPEKQGGVRMMATAPQGMPVEREPSATGEEGVYQVDFPIKPGETRFDLTYVLPQADPLVFSGKVLHSGEAVRLVTPAGVTLSGDEVTPVGQEPQTQATVYDLTSREYSVTVEGSGSLRAPPEAAAPSGGGAGIQQIDAQIYERVEVIVGLALLVLLAGFLLLYRRSSGEIPPDGAPKGKRA